MAFYPEADTYYRIVFKHNETHCLDVASIHRGERLHQQPIDAARQTQLFRFRRASLREYVLHAKASNKSVDVRGASHDNGAWIIQWDPSDREWNEHFQIASCGDGWYELVARHSQKCILAENATKAAGANIVQGPRGSGDHAKFRFVPAGESIDRISGREYVGYANERMRNIIIGVVGKVPEIGSGLAALLTLFWPADDTGARVWEQMKSYVVTLVRELIAQERVIDLTKRLAGLKSALENFQKEAVGSQVRKGAFDHLLGTLRDAEPYFFDPRDPEKTLAHFVALGTLNIATQRELYENYQTIYLEPDPRRAARLKDLQDMIAKYTKGANDARDRVMKWRLDQIHLTQREQQSGISRNYYWGWRDEYTGGGPEWGYNNTTGGQTDAEQLARRGLENRINEIRSSFGAELDRFLAPTRLWKYLNPSETSQPRKVYGEFFTGPVGGIHATEFMDDPKDRPITKIVLHAGSRVDGLEIFYGGVSGGMHGKAGGNRHELVMQDGEFVVSVWGRGGGAIDALAFETNKGRRIGGGGNGGAEWMLDPSDDMAAMLYRVAGRAGSGHIEALKFGWRYWREE